MHFYRNMECTSYVITWKLFFVIICLNENSIVLSEDIEKAFDRVVSVLNELKYFVIPKNIQLLYSFLTNRIMVKIDGFFSNISPLYNAIPQGSPLFAIYANTLSKSLRVMSGIDNVGINADNIFAISSGQPNEVASNLHNFNNKIQNYANKHCAIIPENKSEWLHMCRKRNCSAGPITIGNSNEQCLNKMRIRGIIFSKILSWTEHINLLIGNICKINNLLNLVC